MYLELLKQLKCPECSSDFTLEHPHECGEIVENSIICDNGHQYFIKEGVLDFCSEEQEFGNHWSKMYEKHDYLELDALIEMGNPPSLRNGYKEAQNYLNDYLLDNNFNHILDVATGRGMLLKAMLPKMDGKVLTCTDLSYIVLKFDRLKAMAINPNVQVNYVACDATNMPFKRNTFDCAVSFFGISNIGDALEMGINESIRSAGSLFDIGMIIKDDNPKIPEINQMLADHGHDMTIDSSTESVFTKHHQSEHRSLVIHKIHEGIAEANKHDLIPIENEWYAIVGAEIKAE